MKRHFFTIGLPPTTDKMIRAIVDTLYQNAECHTFMSQVDALAFLNVHCKDEQFGDCVIFLPDVMDDESTAAEFDDAVTKIPQISSTHVSINILQAEDSSHHRMDTQNLGVHIETRTIGSATKDVLTTIFKTHQTNCAQLQ